MKTTTLALLIAVYGRHHLGVEANEHISKRLRTSGVESAPIRDGAADVDATLPDKARQLFDFSGYEGWWLQGGYGAGMSMAPTSAPVSSTPSPVTVAPIAPTVAPVAPIPAPTMAPAPSTFPPITASPTIPAPTDISATPTAAPVVPNTPAPITLTPAPVIITPAPQVTTPAPAVATPAPVITTPAPAVATPAPVITTPAPQVGTPSPVVGTPAPVVTTPAPVVATPAPIVATPTPVVATPAPVIPTPAPVIPPTAAPTTSAPGVADRLQPFLLQGGAEFDDPDSYQSQALRRVEAQVGVEFFSEAKLVQYYALYSLFAATNAVPNIITDADPRFDNLPVFPTWRSKNGWEANNVDPCSGWFGVVCANNQVTELNLFSNLLTGSWPHEVSLLASDGPRGTSGAGAITKIDLFNNEFLFNDFDNSWMTLLGSAMQRLYFQATAFAGSLVPLPVNLFELDCSFTLIDGGLTNQVFNGLNNLNWALLDGNAYNTSVPSVFGSLPTLEFLFISDAFISGDLSYMQGMPRMIEHWIDINPGLGGQIPAFVGNIQTLRSFSVTQASLTGALPASLANLDQMIQMWFYANALQGQIPAALGQISTLEILQLEGNSFSGSMPPEICALTSFPGRLGTLGADCPEIACPTNCCTCCSLQECNPGLF